MFREKCYYTTTNPLFTFEIYKNKLGLKWDHFRETFNRMITITLSFDSVNLTKKSNHNKELITMTIITLSHLCKFTNMYKTADLIKH